MIGGLDERRSTFSQSSQIETGYKLRFGGGFVRSAARRDQRSTGRFHLRDFDDFSLDVVGRRFADLFAILSKHPERILVPPFLNHSQYPASSPSFMWPLALMLPSL